MRSFFAISPRRKKTSFRAQSSSAIQWETLDDRALVEQIKKGHPSGFRVLMSRHQGPIYQVCFKMLKSQSEAEDLTQETFIRAFKALGQFRHQAALSTWLYRIALNLCKNRLAYLKRRQAQSTQGIEDFQGDAWETHPIAYSLQSYVERPDEAFELSETQALLQHALDQLDESLKILIILRDLKGLDYKQIADITQRPLNTVKSRLHVARMRLMNHYKELTSEQNQSSET